MSTMDDVDGRKPRRRCRQALTNNALVLCLSYLKPTQTGKVRADSQENPGGHRGLDRHRLRCLWKVPPRRRLRFIRKSLQR